MATAAASNAAGRCQRCGQPMDATSQHLCVQCGVSMCSRCTKYQYPNRLHAGVCSQCQKVDQSFPCGRCGAHISASKFEFFCSMCAAPLCSNCLWSSFEDGELKCAGCCDYPGEYLLANASVPFVLTEAVLSSFIVPVQDAVAAPCVAASPKPAPPPPPSKYNKLLGKVKLGEGAQGVVYKCRTVDGEIVVSKEMVFDDCDRGVFDSQLRQAMRTKELHHHHLIRYLDVIPYYKPLSLHVIMPYYDEGDLKKFIERQRAPVKEWRLCSIVLQIDIALEYLHTQSPPLVHRDIKPENVLLLNNEEQVLLMDLDLCRAVDISASVVKIKSQSPTYEYKAPELARSAGSIKADVFSLGVVMFVLATLPDFPCVRSASGEEMVLSAAEWTPESLEAALRRDMQRVRGYRYSEEFTRLLVDMLRHDPQRRPTSTEVKLSLQRVMESRLMRGDD